MANRLTGVLLVGGASRRFGSPKALARFRGETLAERGWRTLGEACEERLAVGKAADGLSLPFPLVDDGTASRHPAAGMIAGLEAAGNEVVVVLPVDCPGVEARDLRVLGEACADAAVPAEGKPLPGAYRKTAMAALRRCLSEEASIRSALDELDVRTPALDSWRLADADTPVELELLERRIRAFTAAVEQGAELGLDTSQARILQDWNDTIVHLAPEPVVARVRTSRVRSAEPGYETYAREVAVARHALARHGPVVAPAEAAGPHLRDGLAISLWEYVEELPARPSERQVGVSLRAFHEALLDFAGSLPRLDERLDRAGDAIADPAAVPRLAPADREFLDSTFRALRAEAMSTDAAHRVLHGGPHSANLLSTPAGPRWIDLDTVCRGPLEWDLAHVGEEAAEVFPEADADLLATMRKLVSAEVAIWCWHTYGRAPEVDEAARHHLEALRS
ncbi:MAG: hypothetical protein QOK32_874 [Gaiellaceae bacterium]|nr:hypothetical protein [Gaiellaceae bacterium]